MDNILEMEQNDNTMPGKCIVFSFHYKTIFYVNDCQRLTWYHKNANAKPYAKGNSPSLMISHVVSANYGFLEAQDGSWTAHQIFKPRKNHNSYFTNEDILDQFCKMIAISKSEYPNNEHVFVYNNATIYPKHPENALSACHMPKFIQKPGNNWLIEVSKHTPDGHPVKKPDGTIKKVKVPMADITFDSQVQSFYFPEGHPQAGIFKGIQVILEECGHPEIAKKNA